MTLQLFKNSTTIISLSQEHTQSNIRLYLKVALLVGMVLFTTQNVLLTVMFKHFHTLTVPGTLTCGTR